jgi:hypothetical protein
VKRYGDPRAAAFELDDRVNDIVEQLRSPETQDRNLVEAQTHARAAERRRRSCLDALARAEASDGNDFDAYLELTGDAAQAVVSMYLAAAATQRYCVGKREPGPIKQKDLAALVESTRGLRDAVMHWEEKTQRDGQTFLTVSKTDVLALLPAGRNGPPIVFGLTWGSFRRAARRLDQWATAKLADGQGERSSRKR